jgi:hypothetical protein
MLVKLPPAGLTWHRKPDQTNAQVPYVYCAIPLCCCKTLLIKVPSFVGAAAGASNVCFNSTQMKLRKWCTRKTLRRKGTERSRSCIHGFKLVCLLL